MAARKPSVIRRPLSKVEREFSVKLPDLGLTRSQQAELKKAFDNKVVASLEGRLAARPKRISFPPKTITQKKRQVV